VQVSRHSRCGRMPGPQKCCWRKPTSSTTSCTTWTRSKQRVRGARSGSRHRANDVCEPAARTDKSSPIYGCPSSTTTGRRDIIVFKAQHGRGVCGHREELFYGPKTGMLFATPRRPHGADHRDEERLGRSSGPPGQFPGLTEALDSGIVTRRFSSVRATYSPIAWRAVSKTNGKALRRSIRYAYGRRVSSAAVGDCRGSTVQGSSSLDTTAERRGVPDTGPASGAVPERGSSTQSKKAIAEAAKYSRAHADQA